MLPLSPHPVLELTSEQRRQRTMEALTAQTEALTRQMLMVFEDAHWADPTSLELLGCVVDRIRTLRVLLLVKGHCRCAAESS
jgi:predicted ATPase